MTEYADYYLRIVETGLNGFKLALGGTGLGKTRGIRKIIESSHKYQDERKFIYVANRVQLLNEMYDDLIKNHDLSPNEVIHLERNRDTIVNALSSTNRDGFYKLATSEGIQHYVGKLGLDFVAIERACKQIEHIVDFLETEKDFEITQMMDSNLERLARDVKNFFKLILRNVDDSDYDILVQNPIIQTIFPYIAFKYNEDAKVLLLTIHKGFLGFFDGKYNINLTRVRKNIIFLDEFDFLEPDLLQLICSAPQIEDPFIFVELFHRAMKRHKLPLDEYPVSKKDESKIKQIRARLIEIVEKIDELSEVDGIDFPIINQFTTKIDDKQAAIFQTSRTVVKKPLFLRETSRSFEIITENIAGSFNAMRLFNLVNWATAQILFLFKDIESIDQTIYTEMLNHCFPQSYLADQVRRIAQLPQPHHEQYTRFGALLDSGFGLYEIQDLQQVTDQDEVKFRHYAIHTTPEKVILAMASNNLVFGLSATADIPRFVKHFNEAWIKRQLLDNEANFFEINQEDDEIIQQLNREKIEKRENAVTVSLAKDITEYDDGQKFINFIKTVAEHFVGFGKDDPGGYRRQRAEKFFALLFEIIQCGVKSDETHLLFYTTFSQIEFILSQPKAQDKNLFVAKPISKDRHFRAYRLEFYGQNFNVAFYDAPQAKYIRDSQEAKKNFNQLFWEGIPVILITQYASAGNGVNLQYLPHADATEDDETDFNTVHLLESPFFYFDGIDFDKQTATEITTAIKKNIWYQAKLYEAKVISQSTFLGLLENIRFNDFNSTYRYSPNRGLSDDSLKNRIATYIQALGRTERVWHKIPDQHVVLSHEVLDDFKVFSSEDNFAYILEERQLRLSNNLAQVLEQIPSLVKRVRRKARDHAVETLASTNEKSKQYIHELLQRLHAFRSGNGDERAKSEWIALRLSALEHAFAEQILETYHAYFTTNLADDGLLYMDDELRIYPRGKHPTDARPRRVNSVYDVIQSNKVISDYFMARGFELEFDSASNHFFTPYFYQSILVGAVGEAAIQAVLRANLIRATEDLPDPLYELADLKIKDKPWYIDCKNYSERTLGNFSLPREDIAYHPKLNEGAFIKQAQSKLSKMQKYHANISEPKLVYLNLVHSGDRIKRYLDSDFNAVNSFADAQIIIIQGIIEVSSPNSYSTPFTRFIVDCKNHML